MNASIDIGNTRIKVGLFKENSLVAADSLKEDELIFYLDSKDISGLIVSSVREDKDLIDSLRSYFPKLLYFDHATRIPIQSAYQTPETLGLDRLAAAMGALTHYNGPMLIIDTGSCITIDLIDEDNRFIGGAITPGLEMRLQAMHTFTGKLPLLKLENTDNITGRTTEEAMMSGAVIGSRLEMAGYIENYRREYPEIKVIICGGDRKYFDNIIEFNIFVLPNLVLEGLNAILRFNE